jgi:hypothetical protein
MVAASWIICRTVERADLLLFEYWKWRFSLTLLGGLVTRTS